MSATQAPIAGTLHSMDALHLAVSFAALYIFYLVGTTVYDVYFGPMSKYPGPKLDAISVVPGIRSMIYGDDVKDHVALHAQYGPIVRVGPRTLSYANGATGFKDIYGFGKKGLSKDPQFYGHTLNKVPSIITADDANHSRQRKILSHAFSDRALKEQEPLFKRWIELMRSKLQEQAERGYKVDMLKFYNCTTFDIMGDLTFAEGLNMLNDSEYSPWVKAIFNGIKAGTMIRGIKMYSKLTSYLVEEVFFNTNFVRKKQMEHWNYSKDRVDRRLARTPDRPDLWTKIIEKSEGPDGLSLGEHHSNASLFMIAGTETTATALSGTSYQLMTNPESLAKLANEIRSQVSSSDELTLEFLARQKYLNAVLQEGLRMYPPVPSALPRVTPPGGAAICGEWVPGGVQIGVHHTSTYRNEDLFRKPFEYHPERWLGDPEFANDKLDSLEPFSVGPRNCLGKVCTAPASGVRCQAWYGSC